MCTEIDLSLVEVYRHLKIQIFFFLNLFYLVICFLENTVGRKMKISSNSALSDADYVKKKNTNSFIRGTKHACTWPCLSPPLPGVQYVVNVVRT